MSKNQSEVAAAPASRQDPAALLIALLVAGACAVAAGLVSTDRWATFFAHPQVDQAITLKGAQLWRGMLAFGAVAIVVAMLAIRALATGVEPELTTRSGSSRWSLYAMTGLIVLGLLVRCTRLTESLWYDEIASWHTYNGGTSGFGAVMGAFLDPINHTFHTLLNRFSVQWLAGDVVIEVAFRLPAMLFSLTTIPVMFGLGRAAVSERVGWIAALLAAIAPVCVLEGVEARGYAQMIFFSAAATWTLIEAMRRGSPWLWLLYAVCCALGVWSHFVTAWIAIGHGAWLMWRFARVRQDRSRCGQGMIALALGGVLAITLYAPLIPGLLAWRSNFAAASPDQPRIIGPEGLHALMQLGGAWTWKAAIVGLLAFGGGLIAAMRQGSDDARRVQPHAVLSLSLVGIGLMLAVVAVSGTWLYARFMLFVMPGAMLAMAMGVDAAWRKRIELGIAAMASIVVAGFVEVISLPPKQPLREAVEFVKQRMREGDRVLAVGVAHDVLRIYDYDMELNIANSFMLGRDLEAKLETVQPRWVFVEYPLRVPADRYQVLAAHGYREVARLDGWADWGHGDVLIFSQSEPR